MSTAVKKMDLQRARLAAEHIILESFGLLTENATSSRSALTCSNTLVLWVGPDVPVQTLIRLSRHKLLCDLNHPCTNAGRTAFQLIQHAVTGRLTWESLFTGAWYITEQNREGKTVVRFACNNCTGENSEQCGQPAYMQSNGESRCWRLPDRIGRRDWVTFDDLLEFYEYIRQQTTAGSSVEAHLGQVYRRALLMSTLTTNCDLRVARFLVAQPEDSFYKLVCSRQNLFYVSDENVSLCLKRIQELEHTIGPNWAKATKNHSGTAKVSGTSQSFSIENSKAMTGYVMHVMIVSVPVDQARPPTVFIDGEQVAMEKTFTKLVGPCFQHAFSTLNTVFTQGMSKSSVRLPNLRQLLAAHLQQARLQSSGSQRLAQQQLKGSVAEKKTSSRTAKVVPPALPCSAKHEQERRAKDDLTAGMLSSVASNGIAAMGILDVPRRPAVDTPSTSIALWQVRNCMASAVAMSQPQLSRVVPMPSCNGLDAMLSRFVPSLPQTTAPQSSKQPTALSHPISSTSQVPAGMRSLMPSAGIAIGSFQTTRHHSHAPSGNNGSENIYKVGLGSLPLRSREGARAILRTKGLDHTTYQAFQSSDRGAVGSLEAPLPSGDKAASGDLHDRDHLEGGKSYAHHDVDPSDCGYSSDVILIGETKPNRSLEPTAPKPFNPLRDGPQKKKRPRTVSPATLKPSAGHATAAVAVDGRKRFRENKADQPSNVSKDGFDEPPTVASPSDSLQAFGQRVSELQPPPKTAPAGLAGSSIKSSIRLRQQNAVPLTTVEGCAKGPCQQGAGAGLFTPESSDLPLPLLQQPVQPPSPKAVQTSAPLPQTRQHLPLSLRKKLRRNHLIPAAPVSENKLLHSSARELVDPAVATTTSRLGTSGEHSQGVPSTGSDHYVPKPSTVTEPVVGNDCLPATKLSTAVAQQESIVPVVGEERAGALLGHPPNCSIPKGQRSPSLYLRNPSITLPDAKDPSNCRLATAIDVCSNCGDRLSGNTTDQLLCLSCLSMQQQPTAPKTCSREDAGRPALVAPPPIVPHHANSRPSSRAEVPTIVSDKSEGVQTDVKPTQDDAVGTISAVEPTGGRVVEEGQCSEVEEGELTPRNGDAEVQNTAEDGDDAGATQCKLRKRPRVIYNMNVLQQACGISRRASRRPQQNKLEAVSCPLPLPKEDDAAALSSSRRAASWEPELADNERLDCTGLFINKILPSSTGFSIQKVAQKLILGHQEQCSYQERVRKWCKASKADIRNSLKELLGVAPTDSSATEQKPVANMDLHLKDKEDGDWDSPFKQAAADKGNCASEPVVFVKLLCDGHGVSVVMLEAKEDTGVPALSKEAEQKPAAGAAVQGAAANADSDSAARETAQASTLNDHPGGEVGTANNTVAERMSEQQQQHDEPGHIGHGMEDLGIVGDTEMVDCDAARRVEVLQHGIKQDMQEEGSGVPTTLPPDPHEDPHREEAIGVTQAKLDDFDAENHVATFTLPQDRNQHDVHCPTMLTDDALRAISDKQRDTTKSTVDRHSANPAAARNPSIEPATTVAGAAPSAANKTSRPNSRCFAPPRKDAIGTTASLIAVRRLPNEVGPAPGSAVSLSHESAGLQTSYSGVQPDSQMSVSPPLVSSTQSHSESVAPVQTMHRRKAVARHIREAVCQTNEGPSNGIDVRQGPQSSLAEDAVGGLLRKSGQESSGQHSGAGPRNSDSLFWPLEQAPERRRFLMLTDIIKNAEQMDVM